MESKFPALQLLLFLCFTSLLVLCHSTSAEDDLKTFIVYTGNGEAHEAEALSLYTSMIQEVADSNAGRKKILHHYHRSFNGFVVKLTDKEAERMAGLDGVVSVFRNEKKQLHTTRSWDFLGFSQQVSRVTTESDIIIGVLDSGIWPESDSFADKGLSPPPSKWKGTCQTTNVTCNNKIIGAKFYRADGNFANEDVKSPRDTDGHGTHIASTAAGVPVGMASMLGLGAGTARGAVPSARIAVYKVCWLDGCFDADILAAFDDAIADGVDIISASLGGFNDANYFTDVLAIGAFHAMKKGILTVTSAGNSGPRPGSLANFAPWLISVAATTIDRKFVTKVELGDNKTFEGVSINTFDLGGKFYRLIYGGDAPNTKKGFDGSTSRFCGDNSLDENLVKDKIVLCEGRSGLGPFYSGSSGILTQGQNSRDSGLAFPLPASFLDLRDGADAFAYINSTSNPTATILKSEEAKDSLAPIVASFSARGPNHVTPDILKPDLAAPGVEIVAAWSPVSSPSEVDGDNRTVRFNIVSGTSMACPHVSGAAGYIKSFHPTWSPAAIRSALMTTAKQLSSKASRDAEFAYGAGQIDPVNAVNPGLVYDADETDYIKFLCGQGYSTKTLQLITGDNSSCSGTNNETALDLNYPSFALQTSPSEPISGTFKRTVTNVGSSISTYTATVCNAPPGLRILVKPPVLLFTSVGQKQTFELTIDGTLDDSMASASLIWSDGTVKVRSPIVVHNAS